MAEVEKFLGESVSKVMVEFKKDLCFCGKQKEDTWMPIYSLPCGCDYLDCFEKCSSEFEMFLGKQLNEKKEGKLILYEALRCFCLTEFSQQTLQSIYVTAEKISSSFPDRKLAKELGTGLKQFLSGKGGKR